jgi:hypothetical protein
MLHYDVEARDTKVIQLSVVLALDSPHSFIAFAAKPLTIVLMSLKEHFDVPQWPTLIL